MSFAAYPTRSLTAEEIRRYSDNGVVMIKGPIDPNWVELIQAWRRQGAGETVGPGPFHVSQDERHH